MAALASAESDRAAGSPAGAGPPREYLRFEVVDLNGKALSKTVPARNRATAVYMYSGACAMGANSEVLTFPEEVGSAGCPNFQMVPDWSTEQVLPWASPPGSGVVVRRVYCEQAGGRGKDAKLNQAIPRTVCRRLLEELRAFGGHGYELLVGGELEFSLARRAAEGGGYEPHFQGVDIFATLQVTKAMDFCYDLEGYMEAVGVDFLTMNPEYGAGQLEIAFVPKFGIEAADATATFRTGTKEVAQSRGLLASFMSKPFGMSGPGNGGHFNFSLWAPGGGLPAGEDAVSRVTAGRRNVFHSCEDPDGLSPIARSFLAGVLAHAPALEAICSPTPPCYLRHGRWAPVVANWGPDDRTAAVRVKADPQGSPASCYMEFRMPSAAANPYLVTAALVAAGLDGLERGLALPAAKLGKEQGATPLPTDLESSLKALEADEYMVQKLGGDFVRWFVLVKRAEDKFIQDALAKGSGSDAEVSAAWQHMYLEYV